MVFPLPGNVDMAIVCLLLRVLLVSPLHSLSARRLNPEEDIPTNTDHIAAAIRKVADCRTDCVKNSNIERALTTWRLPNVTKSVSTGAVLCLRDCKIARNWRVLQQAIQIFDDQVAVNIEAIRQLSDSHKSPQHYLVPLLGLIISCVSLLSGLVGVFCCCCREGVPAHHTVDVRRPHTLSPSPTTPARRRILEASRLLHLYHTSPNASSPV